MLSRIQLSLFFLVFSLVGCSGGFAPNSGIPNNIPSFNLTSISGNPTNTVSPNFEISGSVVVGDDITIYVDSTCSTAYASGSFTGDPTVYGGGFLPDGSYPIYLIFTLNSVGGALTSCYSAGMTLVVDTTSPAGPSGWTMSSPVNASVSNDVTPVISGSGLSSENGSTANVYVNDASCSAPNLVGSDVISGGSFSVNTITFANDGSDDGVMNFYGRIVDTANNQSSCVNLSLSYTLDTTGPGGHTISINGGAATTNLTAVTLTLAAVGAVDMYITENATCSSGGSWEAFNTSKVFTLTNLNTVANVYFKVRDAAGNESSCVGDSILHDNIGPLITGTTQPSNGAYSTTNNLDFTVTWNDLVTITGSPRLVITLTTGTVYANIVPAGANTVHTFRYTIAGGDLDANGIVVATTIDLNGGSLLDANSNAADLTFSAMNTTGITIVLGVVSATNSSIVGSGPVVANGASTSTVTITLRDASNVAVQGITPTFSATDTGSTNNYGACSASNASGVSTCTLSSTKAELKTLSLLTPVTFAGGDVSFIAGATSAVTSTITGSGPVVANGVSTSTVTITLFDAFLNPVSGSTPTFSATDTGSTNNYGACSVSNASGVSSCTLSSTKAETKTLSIVTPVSLSGGNVNFIAGAASAVTSIINGSGPVVADGVVSSNINITLLDAFSNPISGTTPTFSATDTGSTNNYSACSASNALGVSTCTLRSTKAESKTLSLITPVAFAGGNVSFIAGPPSALTSTITGSGPVVADGVANSNISVTLLDAFSNPISGTTPTFSATDTGTTNSYGACTASDLAGLASCTLSATKAESKTLSIVTPVAVVGGNVSFIAGAASIANSTIVVCAGPVIADGIQTCSNSINLKDAFLNPLIGTTPTISATDTGSVNSYVACTATDLSGDSTCDFSSMYAEDKTVSIATPIVKAGSNVMFNSRGLDIMVPIEIVHFGLASTTALRTFDRSRTSLNTTDYNGSSVTYIFEIVGLNNHATNPYDVRLVNAAGTTVATITVPIGNVLNRLEIPFTPTAGANNYRIQIPATAAANNVQIFEARIKVKQIAATSTKIYIPLVSDVFNTSSNSTTQQLDQTASLTLAQATPNNFVLWRRDDTAFADIEAGTPWTLEVVGRANNAAGVAQVSLVQGGTTTVVAGSTLTFNGTAISMQSASFASNATNFNSGTNYELKHLINNAAYRSVIFKAGIWVKLTNLKKADTWLKVAGYRTAASSGTIPNQRAMLDLASYENPKAYFEATLQNTTAGGANAQLVTDGTLDTGNGGAAVAVAGSTLSPAGTTRQRLRSGNIYSNLVDYDRVMARSNRTAGTANLVIGFVVVSIDQI